MIRLTVEPPAGDRIDAYLARAIPELSRSQAAQLIAGGYVRRNGQIPRKSEKAAAGDVLEVELPQPAPSALEPEALPLNIVYQDADLLVIDKPAGLVVHPGAGHARGTLVHALLHHIKDLSGIGGVLRPGIVHRLDKDTSGLMLVAKHDQAHRALSVALKERMVRRGYLAATWGHLSSDRLTIDAPLARSPHHRQRMAVVPSGRPAVTHVRRLERWRGADLIRAELETGRTHQIRVHLLSIGHPVVGDRVYAPDAVRGMSGPIQSWARELSRRVPRQFLHANTLQFAHPRTGEPLAFESPLPPDL
ncbi:MAG TPA: RluA family pseudouridine synthase, partial [Longimicrobiales bacterium]|nr:RluA family pseudouridine synthase [Longimicrobiales bacterium]